MHAHNPSGLQAKTFDHSVMCMLWKAPTKQVCRNSWAWEPGAVVECSLDLQPIRIPPRSGPNASSISPHMLKDILHFITAHERSERGTTKVFLNYWTVHHSSPYGYDQSKANVQSVKKNAFYQDTHISFVILSLIFHLFAHGCNPELRMVSTAIKTMRKWNLLIRYHHHESPSFPARHPWPIVNILPSQISVSTKLFGCSVAHKEGPGVWLSSSWDARPPTNNPQWVVNIHCI